MRRNKNGKQILSYITFDTKTKKPKLKFVIAVSDEKGVKRFYFDPDIKEDIASLQNLKTEIEVRLSRIKGS